MFNVKFTSPEQYILTFAYRPFLVLQCMLYWKYLSTCRRRSDVGYWKGKILVVIVVVDGDTFERNVIKQTRFIRYIESIRKKGQVTVTMWIMHCNFDKDAFSRGVCSELSLLEKTCCNFCPAPRVRLMIQKFLISHPNEMK